ncbi:hypothetical protein R1sor_012453 [Riccia sorocarpa]|uniref:Reverse transcriptase domain-containing protein n=1 Tax=Riccia sorocarpa TaxID=122646 RepID=A0ABD3I6I4_9MARC
MTALELESGEVIEEQEDILDEVHRYYQDLYKAEEETAETFAKREKVVSAQDGQSFWDKKSLVGKDSRGIIKLIPKNDKKHLLKNWRPITLLTMTYKIVANIIALRLKDILPRLIDTQQTGFVTGRNIIDNILSLRLGQEWAQATNQDTIFVKLDFMKAYDRVAHWFLWDTLATMGMGEETAQRIKSLVV